MPAPARVRIAKLPRSGPVMRRSFVCGTGAAIVSVSSVEPEASPGAAAELGIGDEQALSIRLGAGQVAVQVFCVPDHHCLPDDFTAHLTARYLMA